MSRRPPRVEKRTSEVYVNSLSSVVLDEDGNE